MEASLEWLLEQSLLVEGKVSDLEGIGIDITDDHVVHEVDIENPCGFLQAMGDANVRSRGGRVPARVIVTQAHAGGPREDGSTEHFPGRGQGGGCRSKRDEVPP